MTPAQRKEEQARANHAMGCSTTLYGCDGDTLAWEGAEDQTTHHLYEPGSFVPLAQAISRKPILLHQQPAYAGAYDIDRDPLWTTSPDPDPVGAMAWYHCDHLGTPQELTDAQAALDNSVQVKETSPRRIGVDAENQEIVILDKTVTHPNGDEEFHGHVRCWCDLHDTHRSALQRSGMATSKGKLGR